MGKLSEICPSHHLKAMLYRRLITVKRSLKSVLVSIIGTVFFSAIGIAIQWLMIYLSRPKFTPVTFDVYVQERNDFVIVGNENEQYIQKITEKMKEVFKSETSREPTFSYFESTEKLHSHLYDLQVENRMNYTIPFGLDFTSGPSSVTILYNASTNPDVESPTDIQVTAYTLFSRILWQLEFDDGLQPPIKLSEYSQQSLENRIGNSVQNYQENTKRKSKTPSDVNNRKTNDITVGYMALWLNMAGIIFGNMGPMLLTCGLLTIVPLIVAQPITDIRGEIRQYMMQCKLKLFPYWLAEWIFDLILWVFITTVVWALFNAGMVASFHDNLFNTWYILIFAGPSFILFTYCFMFLFQHPNSAPRQIFLLLALLLFIAVIIIMIIDDTSPVWLEWIYGLFPHIALQQCLSSVLVRMGSRKENLGFYWKYEHTQPYLIMQFVDIIIYTVLLYIIEMNRLTLQRKSAKRSFANYAEFFKNKKQKNAMSEETQNMTDQVHESHDFAVRIEDVSRLFINAAGEPIPAVNSVSLGVKEGSLFGFLGANGAGKTTLIRMITGALPPSAGTIEIFGTPIDELADLTVLSICPQFNNHLCMELTSREHFKLYSLLFEMNENDQETADYIEKLMKEMELLELANKPLRELSGGDVRKLAVALSFFGPAKLLLLDEPTASLDPVACRCVQEMILEHKGEKTFMLCTHILSEAEMLCDIISIMVKGNVYTVGSPQYLTQKFGKEYKIDLMLDDDTQETCEKVNAFFSSQLPKASLNIKRPVSRIYSIPADIYRLPELFDILQNGEDGDNGFKYFTCSSSSLERVFMEIVHISDMQNQDDENDDTSKEENYLDDDTKDKNDDFEEVSVSSEP